MQDNFITVMAVFSLNGKEYMYKVPKTTKVEIGDFLVVITDKVNAKASLNNLKIVLVTEVHEDDEIDYESDTYIKWAVSKLSFEEYDAQLVEDVNHKDKIRQIQRQRARAAMLNALNGENATTIQHIKNAEM